MKRLFCTIVMVVCVGSVVMAESYARYLKDLITKIEERSDVDPDSFRVDIDMLETELAATGTSGKPGMSGSSGKRWNLSNEEKTVYRSILRGVLATAYRDMMRSNINAFDAETKEGYEKRSREYFGRVLEDMVTLAGQKSRKYEPLIKVEDGSRYYNHNMLAVMLQYVKENSLWLTSEEVDSLNWAARRVYQLAGDRESDIMMRLNELSSYRFDPKESQQRCWNLEALRDSARGLSVQKLVSNQLDIMTERIMEKRVRIELEDNILAGVPCELTLHAKNTEKAEWMIIEYNGEERNWDPDPKYLGKVLEGSRKTYRLSDKARIDKGRREYMAVEDSLKDKVTLPVGVCAVRAIAGNDTTTRVVSLTSLHMLVFNMSDKTTHIKVVDRKSGMPLKGMAVMMYEKYNSDNHTTRITDKNGEVVVKTAQYMKLRAVRDTTKLGTWQEDATEYRIVHNWDYYANDREVTHAALYTDRGLYRPGQTVKVSAMIYSMQGDETRVKTKNSFVVALQDTDGNEVLRDTVTPNHMGVVTSELVLPKGKLGRWLVILKEKKGDTWAHVEDCSIRVEEYKRPTYTIEVEKDTTIYSPEDRIEMRLKAETLSGVAVQGAEVSLTVEASRRGLWWYGRSWQTVAIANTITNDKGMALYDLVPIEKEMIKELCQNAREGEQLWIRVKAVATDNAGETHQTTGMYTVRLKAAKEEEKKEKKEPLKVSKEEVHVGESVDVTFESEDKEAYIFYYVVKSGLRTALTGKSGQSGKALQGNISESLVDSLEMKLSGKLKRTLKCTEQWGDGVNIYIIYVKDGKVHLYRKSVKVPKPDKTLKMEWHTFRDHLTPGQQEEWTVKVTDKDGKAVKGANVMATMYDAALDELEVYEWKFGIPFVTRIATLSFSYTNPTRSPDLYLSHSKNVRNLMPRIFDVLEGFRHIGGNLMGGRALRLRGLKEVPVNAVNVRTYQALSVDGDEGNGLTGVIGGLSKDELAESEEQSAESITDSGDIENVKVSLRENFNETAFFIPCLTTDDEGMAVIRFQLPESITEWKVMGMAHTEDVHFGMLTGRAVAQKDFMVSPQMPRFIRTNDDARIEARVTNLSDHRIEGRATMRLLNAKDETTLVDVRQVAFAAEAGKTTVVGFDIPADRVNEDVVCEISAESGNCSDGERNLLPVLQTRELITENIPFYIEGAGEKEIDIRSLYNNHSETATDKKMEIGYTDNPALDVFRQLSAIQVPKHDNAPCLAAALYSNIAMIDIAEQLSEYSDTLIRNFDKVKAGEQAREAENKLRELQKEDGAWSWFRGMNSSAFITLAVAEHLHRLQSVKGCTEESSRMLRKAMDFLDGYELTKYEEKKANKWSLTPSEFDLRYMAICDVKENEMLSTYLSEISKRMKAMTIYGRAKSACILQKFGKTRDARKYTESVKHYLVYKEGMGRYFATDQAYYSWQDYRLPTQLAAMRCLTIVDKKKNQKLLPDMQMWLLRQKQTQLWDNPLNAIDAADFMLKNAKEESLRKPDTLVVKLNGGSQFAEVAPEKKVIEVDAGTTAITAEKHSDGISWGYVRGTFMEEAAKLNNYTTGELSIEQRLMVKKNNMWVEMNKGEQPTVGMTVRIRSIVHADRDMDFVNVKIQHPACMEPVKTLSGYTSIGERGGYMELHDTITNVFFDWFTKGTTTIDLDYYITRSGVYHSGISSVSCEYAPEFGGYARAFNINVKR